MGFDSPDLRSPSSIYIRQLEEGLLLAKDKLSHLRRHRLPNDKQKTKKDRTSTVTHSIKDDNTRVGSDVVLRYL